MVLDDMERHRWERLLAWLKEVHGMNTGEDDFHVEAREVPGAGRGLFASRDCLRSTLLFKVPSSALMNIQTVAKIYPQLRRRSLSGVQLVSLHLLLHKPLGDADSGDPAFGPYISTLPRDFASHPLTWLVKRDIKQEDLWEQHMLEALPPSTCRRLSTLHERFEEDWRTVSRYMDETPSILAGSSRTHMRFAAPCGQDSQLLMDYLWAWLNVNTRCIFYRLRSTLSDSDNFTLCPVLDFANHNHGKTHIFPVVDSEVWGSMAKKPPKNFLFFGPSQETVRAGQELYLQYGSHSNSFLLSEYGFVNNMSEKEITSGAYPAEVDVQELVEELFSKNTTLGNRLRAVLEVQGYWGDWTLHSASVPAHPSYRLLAALRLLHAFDGALGNDDDDASFDSRIQEWRRVIHGQTDQISPQNEDAWRLSLRRMCRHIVERARAHLRSMKEKDWQSEGAGWREWMAQNVVMLWTEELRVAEAVEASVLAGVDF